MIGLEREYPYKAVGTILRGRSHCGLTTTDIIWVAAALGMGNGAKKWKMDLLPGSFRDCHLRVAEDHIQISDQSIITSWRTIGTPKNQEKFEQWILHDKNIISLEH